MIIPTPPGGGVDITGRMLVDGLEKILGVKIVVSNQPGASGALGVTKLASARPDGYTIAYIWNAPLTMVPHTLTVAYTPDSYAPISQTTGGTPLIFCAHPNFPAANGREFVEHLRQNPNKYTYGNDGVGATVQLAGERLFQQLGIKMRAVPFGGAGETLKSFLGSHVDIYGGSIPPIAPHLKEGKAKCHIATTRDRNKTIPDALSAGDLGFAQEATELWRGAIAPKGVPADRLKILEDAFRRAAQDEKFKESILKGGDDVIGGSSEDFRKLIASEHAAFAKVVQNLGLPKQ
jgi:tripartite-type tricarboxylate transporter receptor subunit TctC